MPSLMRVLILLIAWNGTASGKLLSLNKSITSSRRKRYGKEKTVDDYERCAPLPPSFDAWYELDLGRNYLIDRIQLYDNGQFVENLRNVEIFLASLTEHKDSNLVAKVTNRTNHFNLTFSEPKESRFVTIIREYEILSLCELSVYGDEKLLSLNKSITSSRSGNIRFGPQNVVDGNRESCAVSQLSYDAYYELDLGRNYLIERIELYSCYTRWGGLSGVEIFLASLTDVQRSSSSARVTNNTYHFNFTLLEPTESRFVTVKKNGKNLVLCNLLVYGECIDGEFDQSCDETCNFEEKHCNKERVLCPSGKCLPGFMGRSCEIECMQGRYGDSCSNECGYCKDNTTCNFIDGTCPNGCEPGYTNYTCETKCIQGRYGDNCSKECGYCKDNTTCNFIDGTCPNGCEPGYTNYTCEATCVQGWYGDNCSKDCGYCKDNATCNFIDGTCPYGCVQGYRKTTCDEKCIQGRYGDNCSKECGYCKDNITCNFIDGTCPNGCKPGYTNSTCEAICDRGTYGPDCVNACGKCSGGETCDVISGVCPNGCSEGYDGILCTQGTATLDNMMLVGASIALCLIVAGVVCAVLYRKWKRHRLPSPIVFKLEHQQKLSPAITDTHELPDQMSFELEQHFAEPSKGISGTYELSNHSDFDLECHQGQFDSEFDNQIGQSPLDVTVINEVPGRFAYELETQQGQSLSDVASKYEVPGKCGSL